MAYNVSFGGFDTHGAPGAVAIDQGTPKPFTLDQALAHARKLLLERKLNVTIYDEKGHSITGNDLVACCNGIKKLSPSLRAE